MMKNGEPCTLRGVSTVLEGVTPKPLTKISMAWCFLPYELYTNMRYLQYERLQEMELGHFDNWAATFGETITAVELSPEGTGYRAKKRFARFFNLPELISIFKESADIQTADMLNLPVPTADYHDVVLKPSEFQKELVQGFAKRAELVRTGAVEPKEDNMLKITSDGRKLALDQRLIDDMLPDEENSKAQACVDRAYRLWVEHASEKAAQLIFCDTSTPRKDGGFNVYDEVKKKLIEKGVPKEEIAFIHDANTDIRKANLFAKVRSGQVRFLLGSTTKMGAGTNVQNRLIALHHIDVPWRPSDIEQQEGRILRQGNMFKEVKIFRYITEGTFDAYSWQVIENKQKFISQIMTSKSPVRSADDIDDASLSYAEVKALATGNPYIKEKMDLDIQAAKLKLSKANHTNQIYKLQDNIVKHYPQKISQLKSQLEGYEKDISLHQKNKPADDNKEAFLIKVGDKEYTDPKEGGTALLEYSRKVKITGKSIPVGEYLGFVLSAIYDIYYSSYKIEAKGVLAHTIEMSSNPFGNIQKLNNLFENMQGKKKECSRALETVERQLESAKNEVDKPFEKEVELEKMLRRLAELDTMLNMESEQEKESISFYVAECSGFHNNGEYHEGLTLEDAIEKYKGIPDGRMNAIKALGFCLTTGLEKPFDEVSMDLFRGNRIMMSEVNLVEHVKDNLLIAQAASKLEEEFPSERIQKVKPPRKAFSL